MKTPHLTLILTTALSLSTLMMTGCAVTSAGVKPGDERNFVRSVHDVNAVRAIKARMKRAHGFELGGVNVDAAEGIVLLVGNVQRPEDKVEAERIAWSAKRVVKVGNEIKLKQKQSALQNTKDGILQQSVRTRLTADKTVKGRNIALEVHDGSVYLLGVARTPQELERAAKIASTTKGTREVISYMKLADNQARLVQAHSQTSYAASPYSSQGYSGGAIPYAPPVSAPQMPAPLPQPTYRSLPDALSATPEIPQSLPSAPIARAPDALPDTEPYFVDPVTKERIELPPGVVPIPFIPDQGPGSLGAGGTPPPGGADADPFYVDPQSGQRIPVTFLSNGSFVIESKYLSVIR